MILKFIIIIIAFFVLVALVSSPVVRGGKKELKEGLNKEEGGEGDLGKPLSHSVADELNKLADLMERGYLTKEEFEKQKRKLLDEPY